MDSNYGEFQGTDLDPSADWDFDDDFDDEGNDLLPILGASVLLAAVVGGVLVGVGRRRNPGVRRPTPRAGEGSRCELSCLLPRKWAPFGHGGP